ncbi:MAG: response regulator [Rhodothermales bacterium]
MTDPLDLLLVDDSKADRALVRTLLARHYHVREAATAREARALLGADEPDLVLLDYRLPDAAGVDLLPAFVERHVPVVMLTGMETPEIIVEAMRGGAHDYLTKGRLTEEGLERAIANAVEKAALRRALDAQQRALAEHAAALEAKNREVRALASALTLAEQAERRRVADLLHDNVQQMLFGVKLALRLLHAPAVSPEATHKRLTDAEDILDQAIDVTRHLAVELTPPVLDREDMAVALRWLAEHMGGMYGMTIEVTAACPCRIPSRELRILVVQIIRELLFNVVKHAGVDAARLRLESCDGGAVFVVEDDGCGFDPAAAESSEDEGPAGFGLYSVRQRLELVGGSLAIESAPGDGCRITLAAPEEWMSDGA